MQETSMQKLLKIPRLFTGDDGQSHWDEVEVDLSPVLSDGVMSDRSSLQGTTSISFRVAPADTFVDWHPAPRRQYVINLAGEVEVGIGDGTKRRFGPGGVFLAADLTGQGHTSQGIGSVPRVSAYIPLAD